MPRKKKEETSVPPKTQTRATKNKRAKISRKKVKENKENRVLLKKIWDLLNQKKAEDLVILDLREISGYLEFFVIATALSPLHVKNLTHEILRLMDEEKRKPFAPVESNFSSGWQVLDYGDIVVHIFNKEKRELYNLEKLWEKAKQISF
ncbi:MAG: ribosome silencing factor [Leptospiraceae bacterium]|nr:ribosome silencing factor [Leptospiraceae bacterium]MDW8307273.1 ribosome silencing factor [Leptospiraceae bacterium]